jgi:hypothetical protein
MTSEKDNLSHVQSRDSEKDMATAKQAKPTKTAKGPNEGRFIRMPSELWQACEKAAANDVRELNDWIRLQLRKAATAKP